MIVTEAGVLEDRAIKTGIEQKQNLNPGEGNKLKHSLVAGLYIPQARTKEAAILMLCDCSESATRAISEPSHGRIESLVRTLARRRLDDGQFDDCPLTFTELKIVEDTIIKTLSAIHHGRIAYPSTSRIEPKTEIRGDAARA